MLLLTLADMGTGWNTIIKVKSIISSRTLNKHRIDVVRMRNRAIKKWNIKPHFSKFPVHFNPAHTDAFSKISVSIIVNEYNVLRLSTLVFFTMHTRSPKRFLQTYTPPFLIVLMCSEGETANKTLLNENALVWAGPYRLLCIFSWLKE